MPAFNAQLHKHVAVEWFLEGDIVKQLYLHEKNSTAVLFREIEVFWWITSNSPLTALSSNI